MKRKLLIAADLDPRIADLARHDFDVVVKPVRSEEELAAIVGDAHVVVTRAYSRMSRRVIEAATRLEVIAQGTSGTDNIDEAAARERGVTVISLPGENANAVAELVIGYMLSLTRTIPFYTREVAAGKWPRDDCATRHELRHFRLGIIGLGQVGMRVAALARAFSMEVAAYDPYLADAQISERNATRAASVDELLSWSDILTVHVPLTGETRRMIGTKQLRTMRRGSILISAARGEIIDQHAAIEALTSGHLGGLAMDVFDPEPPLSSFPNDPRLILTPHVAGCTYECRHAIGEKLWEKIAKFYAERSEASPVTSRQT